MKRRYTRFRPRIRSRHPSHRPLRHRVLPLFKMRSVIRFGSTTELKRHPRVEVNTTEAVRISSNKKRMKEAFTKGNVRTALWYSFINGQLYDHINKRNIEREQLPFPIVSKSLYGSRNKGNKKLDTLEDFNNFIRNKSNLNNYIFEKYYNFAKEYRLHVTEDGCFYTCRKMMKRDTPEEDKWFKNDQNCVWILEENPSFDKPNNWKDIETECVKALKAVGLDFGAVDLRVQSTINNPSFVVIEINSAPSFGNVTLEKYKEILPKLVNKKITEYENSL